MLSGDAVNLHALNSFSGVALILADNESQFQHGMTWDNIAIDHKMPCGRTRRADEMFSLEQFAAFNYTPKW